MTTEETVVRLIRDGVVTGRDIRRALNARRCWLFRYSLAGFYFMMARLEYKGVIVRMTLTELMCSCTGQIYYQSTYIYGVQDPK